LHWTQAGRGIVHEEVPEHAGRTAHGLQIFVNLAARDKHSTPSVAHVDAPEMPTARLYGATLRVVFGDYLDLRSPLRPDAAATLVDVSVPPQSVLSLPIPRDRSAFIVVVDGSLSLAAAPSWSLDTARGLSVASGPMEQEVVLRGHAGAPRLALFLGSPLRENVVFGGPFVMNTAAEINEAERDYLAGRMGDLGAA